MDKWRKSRKGKKRIISTNDQTNKKRTIMVAAATNPDKTEEEETNFMRWGKMIRKWFPSLKTIGKTIWKSGNSRRKYLKDNGLIFQRKKCCHLWCSEAFLSILCLLPSSISTIDWTPEPNLIQPILLSYNLSFFVDNNFVSALLTFF